MKLSKFISTRAKPYPCVAGAPPRAGAPPHAVHRPKPEHRAVRAKPEHRTVRPTAEAFRSAQTAAFPPPR